MGFDVPVSGVDRAPGRGGRVVAAGLLAFAMVVGLGLASGGALPTSRGASVPSTGLPVAASPDAGGATLPRTIPASVTCRDVDRAGCLRMAKAALLALPIDAPDAIDATVWRSLLCNDNLDCPPALINATTPLGSVIIGFADGSPRAAVNVVEGRTGPILRAPRAWVVRWMPELG